MNPLLIEAQDRWEIAVSGWLISQCCYDYGIVVRSSTVGGELEIRISGPFVLIETNGDRFEIDPEGDRVRLAPSLAVFGRAFNRVTAFKSGRLEIDFTDHSSLVVPPEGDFEPWSLVGPRDLRIVSRPGGDLAIWHPDDGT